MTRITELTVLQAGAIPFRLREGRLEVLLVTASKRRRWIVPKGHREAHQTLREAAVAEALEEAGVRGEASSLPFACWTYEKRGLYHRVELFPLLVTEELPEWEEDGKRLRRWFPAAKALRKLREPELIQAIERLEGTLVETLSGGAVTSVENM